MTRRGRQDLIVGDKKNLGNSDMTRMRDEIQSLAMTRETSMLLWIILRLWKIDWGQIEKRLAMTKRDDTNNKRWRKWGKEITETI